MRLKLLQLWLGCQQEKTGPGDRDLRGTGNGKAIAKKGKGNGKTNRLSLYPFPFYPVSLLPFLRCFTFQQCPAGRQNCGSQQDLDNVAGNVLQINQEGR